MKFSDYNKAKILGILPHKFKVVKLVLMQFQCLTLLYLGLLFISYKFSTVRIYNQKRQ